MSLIITQVGQSQIDNAIALNQQLNITKIAVGSGSGYTPTGAETTLKTEIYRNTVNGSNIDNSQANFEITIPVNAGNMVIGEIGLFDSAGNMIAIEVFDSLINKSTTTEITFNISINVVNANEVIQVVIDPSQVLATKKYVDTTISSGATTTKKGIVELATNTETLTGTDTTRAITSAALVHYFEKKGAPTGTIIQSASQIVPSGYLKADGATISRTAYANLFSAIGTTFGAGDGSTTFNVPDLRGEFIRGWDNGKGTDSGRTFGSSQEDEIESHFHRPQGYSGNSTIVFFSGHDGTGLGYAYPALGGSGSKQFSGFINQTDPFGGTETRPRNIALNYIIKY